MVVHGHTYTYTHTDIACVNVRARARKPECRLDASVVRARTRSENLVGDRTRRDSVSKNSRLENTAKNHCFYDNYRHLVPQRLSSTLRTCPRVPDTLDASPITDQLHARCPSNLRTTVKRLAFSISMMVLMG